VNRRGYANGFKPKGLKTRVGMLNLKIPPVRKSVFYPSCLENEIRSERALGLSMAAMYVQGVSKRKVSRIVEELCGFEISSSDVNRASKLLDEESEQWRYRTIGTIKYLLFRCLL